MRVVPVVYTQDPETTQGTSSIAPRAGYSECIYIGNGAKFGHRNRNPTLLRPAELLGAPLLAPLVRRRLAVLGSSRSAQSRSNTELTARALVCGSRSRLSHEGACLPRISFCRRFHAGFCASISSADIRCAAIVSL